MQTCQLIVVSCFVSGPRKLFGDKLLSTHTNMFNYLFFLFSEKVKIYMFQEVYDSSLKTSHV